MWLTRRQLAVLSNAIADILTVDAALAGEERVEAHARRDRGMDQGSGADARDATGNCGARGGRAEARCQRGTAEPAFIKTDADNRTRRHARSRRHPTMMMVVVMTML